MDREAWYAAVHGVAKSQTQLSNWTELNWKSRLILGLKIITQKYLYILTWEQELRPLSGSIRTGIVLPNSHPFTYEGEGTRGFPRHSGLVRGLQQKCYGLCLLPACDTWRQVMRLEVLSGSVEQRGVARERLEGEGGWVGQSKRMREGFLWIICILDRCFS